MLTEPASSSSMPSMPQSEPTLQQALREVRVRIDNACQNAHRTAKTVQLLAVSKMVPSPRIAAAHKYGQTAFGENYVQEGVAKIQELAALRANLEWHFIGPLQSNKTMAVATHFDWVHTIDRLKIAERLSQQRPINLPPLQVCIQVNISREHSKSGATPEDTLALAQQVAALDNLRLRGLMAIPADNSDTQCKAFTQLRQLFITCNTVFSRHGIAPMDTLSMGMSADLEDAIREGSTLVRVGSAIFGRRLKYSETENNK